MKDLIIRILREEIQKKWFLSESYNNNVWQYGCNLFPQNSELKDWCKSAESKFMLNYSIKNRVKKSIFKIASKLKDDNEEKYRERIKFYSIDDPFFKQNTENLNDLESYIKKSCSKAEDTIKNFKKEFAKTFLFVKKEGDEIKYDDLSKLNTNYSALAYLLTDFRNRMDLSNSFDDIFEMYFEKPSTRNELSEPFFTNFIFSYFGNNEKAINIMKNIYSTIEETTEKGQKSEGEAFIRLNTEYGEGNVKIFSGDFSFGDLLGVDMVIKKNGEWIPVQIKKNFDKCKGNYRFCKNICMGKKGREWKSEDYDGENIVNSEIIKPEIKLQKKGTPPPSSDYIGWLANQ
jgi:hypothetical protein